MKKNVITVLLSVVLAAGSIGTAPVLAAEAMANGATAEEAVSLQQEESLDVQEEASDPTEEVETGSVSDEIFEETADEEEVIREIEEQGQNTELPTYEVEETTEAEEEDTSERDESLDTSEQDETSDSAATEEPACDKEEYTEVLSDEESTTAETATTKEASVIEEEIEVTEENEATLEGDLVDSGMFGENLTWTLTGKGNNLTLIISGSGDMPHYSEYNLPPWYSHRLTIRTLVIEDGVSSIGNYAFYNCNILNANLSDSVTSVGAHAFRKCVILKSIVLPNRIDYIGEYAFEECSSLANVNIPDGISVIEKNTFWGCGSLTAIVLPESLTKIGRYAFMGCKNLTSMVIPESVDQIDSGAFGACGSLTSINLPNGLSEISSGLLDACPNLTSVSIPDGVTRIGSFAFGGCHYLTNVILPDGLIQIDEYAFSGCLNLTSITIPNEVIQIGDHAFARCSNLKEIVIRENVLRLGEYAFSDDNGMQADVYTIQGCAADQYFTSINNQEKYTFTMHYPCDPEGHAYGDWEVVTEPTCKDTGLKERRCTNCGDKQTELIPVTSNHTWENDYTVDVEPTYDAEGSESIHCSICSTIKPDSIRTIQKVRKPLKLLTVSGIENRIHNGKEQILDLVVIDGGTILSEGTDYTVVYENNVNVGIASVTVTGTGHYIGTYSSTFPILPAASSKVTCTNVASGIKVSWVKVEGATSYYVYRDDKLLFRTSALEVTDKEIKYDTGTKFTYRVIASAKGVGNSTKSRTAKMFRLMPVGIKSLTNPSAGKMTETYDKCSSCYGYVVRYGLNKDMSDANVITVKGENTLSRTFGGMKKGKTYYVQVRTYMLEYGVRYYSGYCTTKTITIKK